MDLRRHWEDVDAFGSCSGFAGTKTGSKAKENNGHEAFIEQGRRQRRQPPVYSNTEVQDEGKVRYK